MVDIYLVLIRCKENIFIDEQYIEQQEIEPVKSLLPNNIDTLGLLYWLGYSCFP